MAHCVQVIEYPERLFGVDRHAFSELVEHFPPSSMLIATSRQERRVIGGEQF
jgi:hypothetical protein